jgi:hypothetical protein
MGIFAKKNVIWRRGDRKSLSWFAISMDIQLRARSCALHRQRLLVNAHLRTWLAAMGQAAVRFFAVEHISADDRSRDPGASAP